MVVAKDWGKKGDVGKTVQTSNKKVNNFQAYNVQHFGYR